MPDKQKQRVYLYSIHKGKFTMYEGHIAETGKKVFYSKTRNFNCSPNEGEVYNSSVWLSDRNDDLAKKILINHEEFEISALHEEITRHYKRIELLKGVV